MNGRELFFHAEEVEPWQTGRRAPDALTCHLPAEGEALQVEEPRRALDVRQGIPGRHLQPLEELSARECLAELPQELVRVVLVHAEGRDQVPIGVIQHLDRRRRLQEEQRRGAAEGLHVAAVLWKQWEQVLGQPTPSPDPGDEREHANLRQTGHCQADTEKRPNILVTNEEAASWATVCRAMAGASLQIAFRCS